nr:MAG TPA: hypothetical protein [Bacteriophage sp.]
MHLHLLGLFYQNFLFSIHHQNIQNYQPNNKHLLFYHLMEQMDPRNFY